MSTDLLEPSDLSRSDPLAVCHAARLRREQGDVRGAVAELGRAVRRFPESGLVWNDRAAVLVLAGKARKAVEAARRAQELLPDSALPWDTLGDAYAALERPGRALECWERALETGGHPERRAVQRKVEASERRLAREAREWRVFTDRARRRVWAVRVRDGEVSVRDGRLGEKGRRRSARHPSPRVALRKAERLIAAKRKEGFRRVRRKG